MPDPGPDSRLATEATEIRSLCESALAHQSHSHSRVANDLLAWTFALDARIAPESLAALQQIQSRQEAVHRTREIRAALALAAFRTGDTKLARVTSLDLLGNRPDDDRAAKCCRRILAALGIDVPAMVKDQS